jgi:hypothetical protein
MSERVEQAKALLNLAKTQCCLSHEYEAWAREARDTNTRNRHHTEAVRLWDAAKWHLQWARRIVYG